MLALHSKLKRKAWKQKLVMINMLTPSSSSSTRKTTEVYWFQPGLAKRRYKIRDLRATCDVIDKSLHCFNDQQTFDTIEAFCESLTYNDRGYVFDYYYTPIKVKRIAEYLYVVSAGEERHFSMTYAARGHRNECGNWVEGWKGNIWGMTHGYSSSTNSFSGVHACLQALKERLGGHCVFTWKRDRPKRDKNTPYVKPKTNEEYKQLAALTEKRRRDEKKERYKEQHSTLEQFRNQWYKSPYSSFTLM